MEKSNYFKKILILVGCALLLFGITFAFGCSQEDFAKEPHEEITGMQHHDGYQLTQATLLSRHNMRAPITDGGSELSKVTTHEWLPFSAKAGELSEKGGLLETNMGQYFRNFYVKENLISKGWSPSGDEALFYSNSYQRTIATARYFSAGMVPGENVNIFYKPELNQKDPVFFGTLPKVSDEFNAKVESELNEQVEGLKDINKRLKDNYTLLEKVLDYKNSEYAKEKGVSEFPRGEFEYEFASRSFPIPKGDFMVAADAADALMVQYYEHEGDDASFNNKLSYEDWRKIGQIYDAYITTMFWSKSADILIAQDTYKELVADINNPNRKFTFLCGHDSTITTTLLGMGVTNREIPYCLSQTCPLGAKFVVNKYKNASGEEFVEPLLVYQTSLQMRYAKTLSLDTPPYAMALDFEGLQKNSDGLIKLSDFMARLNSVIK